MFKRHLRQSDYFLIAANLLPVLGAWFIGWDAVEIFTVYCLETIIIGFYTLVKMGVATGYKKKDDWYNQGTKTRVSGLFFMFFFLMHYGIFVAGQMGIFFSVSGIGDYYHINFFNFFFKWPEILSNDSLIMLTAFFIAYGFATIKDFILTRQYKTIPLMILMFQPYLRIFIQQVTVILGSMFLLFGAGKIFITVFALVKIFFELYINYDALLKKATIDLKKESREK
jgi:hypothetical protein